MQQPRPYAVSAVIVSLGDPSVDVQSRKSSQADVVFELIAWAS